ncbi:hypothetical protein GCM10022210_28990 [Mucilaginibacter dorajii]|uniref:Uncharacterized protein n=1 Tax=Mucilaginibacter dorajii TaxID=692994 RepID=A0ABP7Q4V9_9SPHI
MGNWRDPRYPGKKLPEQGRRYNLTQGNAPEDDRESEWFIVAMKFRNGNGAKGPY